MKLTANERASLATIQAKGYRGDVHGRTLEALLKKGLLVHRKGGGGFLVTPAGASAAKAIPLTISETRAPMTTRRAMERALDEIKDEIDRGLDAIISKRLRLEAAQDLVEYITLHRLDGAP